MRESGLPSLGSKPQYNLPLTEHGAIRGIHAERINKLVCVGYGAIYSAIVDLRPGSDTFGSWEGFVLTRGMGLFVSTGLGNSFQTTSKEPSVYSYIFNEEWTPDMGTGNITPLDPDLDIPWPIKYGEGMIISDKDLRAPTLAQLRNNE